MTALDDAIQEAARSGLQGLTLYSTQDGRWQASTTQDRVGWSVHIADTPIAAARAALTAFAPTVSEMTTDKGDIFA